MGKGGKDRREVGTWSRMGMRLGIWETRIEEEEVVHGRETEEAKRAYIRIHVCVYTYADTRECGWKEVQSARPCAS